MRRLWPILLLLASPALGVDAYGLGNTIGAGYTARANGMDLDDDWSVGESGDVAGTDDDLACDDNTGTSGPIEEDLDNDGYDEVQIYVRPDVGTDNSQCGGPGVSVTGGACATVQYVIDNRMNTGTDHSGAVEDYICLYGTANEQLTIGNEDGDAGTKTRTKVGLEQIVDFQYPSNPNVLMGADWDQDGEYPPYDTDDTAVFVGNTPVDYDWFIKLNNGDSTNDTDRWEFSHFSIQLYGTTNDVDAVFSGSWTTGDLDGELMDHVYEHDIEMYRINYQMYRGANTIFFQKGFSHEYNYHAIENMNCLECCGFVHRGSTDTDTLATNLRWRNTTITYACSPTEPDVKNGPIPTGVKIWGQRDNTEYLYNNWDADRTAFVGAEEWACSAGTGYQIVDGCVQDLWIMGNRIANYTVGVRFTGNLDGQCLTGTRNMDDLYAAYNLLELSSNDCTDGNFNAFNVDNGLDHPSNFLEDSYIYNNIVYDTSTTSDWGQCLYVNSGVDQASSGDPSSSYTVFSGNTCHSDDWADGSAHRIINIDTENDKPHNYVISNNIITGGTDGEIQIYVDDAESMTSDYNVFENSGNNNFNWLGQLYGTLPLFVAASSTNTNSKGEGQNHCLVTFENSPTDLHLDTTDTCAQEEGSSMSAYYTDDYDGDARPQSTNWDIGADEYASGYTPGGACCVSGGSCGITTLSACENPDIWMGAGTTCSPDPCVPPEGAPVSGLAEGVSLSGVRID